MKRLVTVDLRRRLRALGPAWLVETAVALGCVALSFVVRVVMDAITPGVLAFGVIYPICLLATLLAGWRSGLITLALSGLFAWYFVLTPNHTFALPDLKSELNVSLFFLTAAMIVFLADQAVNEQDKGLAERDLLIEEINHRTKNNFQIVISLLELQSRRTDAPAVREAMSAAVVRIGGLARSHRALYVTGDPRQTVAMDTYLAELCENLSEGPGMGGFVRIETNLAPIWMPRDRAVAVGVILNELITNAFKHAFPDGRAGVVLVDLRHGEQGYELSVADDGVGLSNGVTRPPSSGLGRGLIDGFARQAGGTVTLADREQGGAVAMVTLRP
jgi:two-component sensor histidine kinase